MIDWIEWIGYAASFFIAVSLLMTDLKKLRILNTIGCITFITYGILVSAYPVVISNVVIAFINVYYLVKMRKGAK